MYGLALTRPQDGDWQSSRFGIVRYGINRRLVFREGVCRSAQGHQIAPAYGRVSAEHPGTQSQDRFRCSYDFRTRALRTATAAKAVISYDQIKGLTSLDACKRVICLRLNICSHTALILYGKYCRSFLPVIGKSCRYKR